MPGGRRVRMIGKQAWTGATAITGLFISAGGTGTVEFDSETDTDILVID